jgi:hypothetical protein
MSRELDALEAAALDALVHLRAPASRTLLDALQAGRRSNIIEARLAVALEARGVPLPQDVHLQCQRCGSTVHRTVHCEVPAHLVGER